MATFYEMIQAVESFIAGSEGLNVTTIKGYPDFQHKTIDPPLASIFYGGSGVSASIRRIGKTTHTPVLTLGYYGENEIDLFNKAETLQGLREKTIKLTAGSGDQAQTIVLRVGDDERDPPDENAPKEVRHALTCLLTIIYERSQ